MTIKIPDTIFDGLVKWMGRGPWPEYFQEAIDDHLHAYCDRSSKHITAVIDLMCSQKLAFDKVCTLLDTKIIVQSCSRHLLTFR